MDEDCGELVGGDEGFVEVPEEGVFQSEGEGWFWLLVCWEGRIDLVDVMI